jgi:hypothetical protein
MHSEVIENKSGMKRNFLKSVEKILMVREIEISFT